MSDQSPSNNSLPPKTPGELLRAAREERGLQQSAVAEQLRLSVQTIKDLENDDYQHFSAEIYLRGHMRSFCRIVNLEEKVVLQCYDAMGHVFESERHDRLLTSQVPIGTRARRKNRRALWWIGVTVLLLVVVMVILWWQEQQSHLYYSLSKATSQATAHTQPKSIPIKPEKLVTSKALNTTSIAHHHSSHAITKKTVSASFKPDYQVIPVKH